MLVGGKVATSLVAGQSTWQVGDMPVFRDWICRLIDIPTRVLCALRVERELDTSEIAHAISYGEDAAKKGALALLDRRMVRRTRVGRRYVYRLTKYGTTTALQAIKQHGVTTAGDDVTVGFLRPVPRPTNAEKRRALDRRIRQDDAAGLSIRAIAKRQDVSYNVVYRTLRRFGNVPAPSEADYDLVLSALFIEAALDKQEIQHAVGFESNQVSRMVSELRKTGKVALSTAGIYRLTQSGAESAMRAILRTGIEKLTSVPRPTRADLNAARVLSVQARRTEKGSRQ